MKRKSRIQRDSVDSASSLASTWHFSNPDNAQALVTEARSWWGTPFAYHSRAKGAHGGIDCAGFCEEVTAAAGLDHWVFPRSDQDYSRHLHNDKILNHLRGLSDNDASHTLAARWAELPVIDHHFTAPLMIGDLVIYKDAGRNGVGVFHMGLMISETIFMQCAPRLGVLEGQVDDTSYSDHLVAHFRARALEGG